MLWKEIIQILVYIFPPYIPQKERTWLLCKDSCLSPCSINLHFIPTLGNCTKAVFIGQSCAGVSKVTQIFKEKERVRVRVRKEAEQEGRCRIPLDAERCRAGERLCGSAELTRVAWGCVSAFDPFNLIRRHWSYTVTKVRGEELCSLQFQTSKSANYHRPLRAMS